jgi:hypothetical protein
MRALFALLLTIPLFASHAARADDPAFCSFSSGGGTSDPPSGRVAITIHSMRLNDDLELDVWPFDNRADVYGVIDINANGTWEDFHLPEIEGSDFPHWSTGNKFVSFPATPGVPVHVIIHMREADVQFSDIIDTSPDPAKDDLEFFIDTCSLRISGDITGTISEPLSVTSGTGTHQGTLLFEVRMDDHRPISNTTNDVALAGFDLVQVLPNPSRLIAQKPTLALLTVANNAPVSTDVSARVRIRQVGGSGSTLYDVTENLGTFAAGEVRSTYVGVSSPFLPPRAGCGSYELTASATLILDPNLEPGGRDCWTFNNTSAMDRVQVVAAKVPSLLWQPAGMVFNGGATASGAEVATIHDLGLPLIRGAYPIANITDSISMFPFSPTLNQPLVEFFGPIFAVLGLVQELVYPVVLLVELNIAAAMSGFNRVLGVLPPHWFDEAILGAWSGAAGLSLGEAMQRAVIFEAESNDTAGTNGILMTAPAHELGHTYSLSVDPTIKGWYCSIPGTLPALACGMFGGLDEISSSTHPDGLKTWGFWIPQGFPAAPSGVTGEQCNSHCLMGSARLDQHLSWGTNGRWIDAADYDHLIDKLQNTCTVAPTGVAFVSGVIDQNDNAILISTFRRPGELREPDFATTPRDVAAAYGLKFVDGAGTVLSESEVPLSWSHPESPLQLPMTIFSGFAEFPTGTTRIELWSRLSGKQLAHRAITPNPPVLGTPSAVVTTQSNGDRLLEIQWSSSDADKDELTHYVQLAPVRTAELWPVAHGLSTPNAAIPIPAGLSPGSYTVRALSSDGVHLIHRDVTIQL